MGDYGGQVLNYQFLYNHKLIIQDLTPFSFSG